MRVACEPSHSPSSASAHPWALGWAPGTGWHRLTSFISACTLPLQGKGETAFKCIAAKALLGCGRQNKLATLEFDRDRKSMSVICSHAKNDGRPATQNSAQGNTLLVKGAAECILARCNKVTALFH